MVASRFALLALLCQLKLGTNLREELSFFLPYNTKIPAFTSLVSNRRSSKHLYVHAIEAKLTFMKAHQARHVT